MNTTDPREILQLAQGFMESRILHAAAELNLFTLLHRTPLTAAQIADKIKVNAQAIAVLLDAVAAIGLLAKRGQTYHCDDSVSRFLSSESPESVLPMVLHMSYLWERWTRLPDIARGISKETFDFTRHDEDLRAFIGAMHSIGAPLAKQIVASVRPEQSRSLIDIAGGSGTYTIAFLRAVPEMRATLFDLPEVIEMARERISKEGLLNRVTLAPGSYYENELPQGHDLALVSAIIHSLSPEENLELFKKAFRSLQPGGRILVRDHVMDPDRIRPRDGAIFAINMLVGTSGGKCYTYEEIKSGLQHAGFKDVKLIRQGEHMDAVVEAFKP